jgi:NAD(P)H-dependent FMN reductase
VRVAVVTGTTREGRFSEKVADWVTSVLSEVDDVEVEVIDLRDYPLPFFDGPPPARAPRQYLTGEVRRLGESIECADGYVGASICCRGGSPAGW